MQSWTSSMIRLPNYTWCPNAKTFLLSVLSNWPIDEDFMINITMVFGEIFLRYWWTALHIIVAFSGLKPVLMFWLGADLPHFKIGLRASHLGGEFCIRDGGCDIWGWWIWYLGWWIRYLGWWIWYLQGWWLWYLAQIIWDGEFSMGDVVFSICGKYQPCLLPQDFALGSRAVWPILFCVDMTGWYGGWS